MTKRAVSAGSTGLQAGNTSVRASAAADPAVIEKSRRWSPREHHLGTRICIARPAATCAVRAGIRTHDGHLQSIGAKGVHDLHPLARYAPEPPAGGASRGLSPAIQGDRSARKRPGIGKDSRRFHPEPAEGWPHPAPDCRATGRTAPDGRMLGGREFPIRTTHSRLAEFAFRRGIANACRRQEAQECQAWREAGLCLDSRRPRAACRCTRWKKWRVRGCLAHRMGVGSIAFARRVSNTDQCVAIKSEFLTEKLSCKISRSA